MWRVKHFFPLLIELFLTTTNAFIWGHDTTQQSGEESSSFDGKSKLNKHEGTVVGIIAKNLVTHGKVLKRQIGIITPYAAQVRWVRQSFVSEHSTSADPRFALLV